MTRFKASVRAEVMALVDAGTLAEPLALDAIGALVIGTADAAAARDFYCRILGGEGRGSDILPNTGPHEVVGLPSGQMLALAQIFDPGDLSQTGAHQAYRASAAGCDAIAARLGEAGIEIHGYREDRAAEQDDRFYFVDPDGNRVQIVVRADAGGNEGVYGIDHAAVQLPDMLWGEHFYGEVLGLGVESRFGVHTSDHAEARLWAKGEDDMAPGTRRLDKLYMAMGGQNEVARANMQVFFNAGDSVIGVYLATRHYQEAPEEQLTGAPRIMLAAPRASLDAVAAALEAAGRSSLGPVAHPASAPFSASLYFKDTGSNFLEIYARD
jgi:catechol 2,3-dioxygenase-like lactoylglutathione lyase family enzyme